MNKNLLKKGINGSLDDGCFRLSRRTFMVYGGDDWPSIHAALEEWKAKGYLKILRDPQTAKDDEICVEMLSYIEQKSPWPNWP